MLKKILNRSIPFLGIILAYFNCAGQYVKTYGHEFGNNANSIIINSSNNYVISGWYDVNQAFSAEFFLMELTPEGDTVWANTYGPTVDTISTKNGSGNEGFEVIECFDGGYLMVGEVHQFGPGLYDPFFVRVDALGDTIWTKTYGTTSKDVTYSICQLVDSGFVGVGYTEGISQGAKDALVIRINQQGDTLWTRSIGTTSIDGALDVIETFDDQILVLGYTYDYWGTDSDIWLIKLESSNGAIISERIYGGSGHDFGQSIIENYDSTYTIVGSTESSGAGMSDCLVMKVAENGDLIYGRSYGGGDREAFYDVEHSNSGLSVVGFTRSFGGGWEDVLLVSLNETSDTNFVKTYGSIVSDFGRDHVLHNGDFVIAGQTLNFGAGSTDILMIKADSLGNTNCLSGNASLELSTVSFNDSTVTSAISSGLVVERAPTLVGKTRIEPSNPCSTILIEENTIENKPLILYPNPTVEEINITDIYNYSSISIVNTTGNEVYKQDFPNSGMIKLEVPVGIYFVTAVEKSSGYFYQAKLVVVNPN